MKSNWNLKNQYVIKKGNKRYDYYSIVEPYRKDGKNRHQIILRLGRLTSEQAQIIRNVLKVTKSEDVITIKLEDLLFEKHWRYLDVAFLDRLWDGWGLSGVFPLPGETSGTGRKKDMSTADVAKALAIYRCLDPGSYLSAAEWFKRTALDHILQIGGCDGGESKFNDSRIYRELTAIEEKKGELEKHLYATLRERDEKSFRVVFYDLTDSYFEGRKCDLAGPGRTKANGFRKKRIVLSLLVNSAGYPFAWDVLEDYTADVKTIKGLSSRWKAQFGLGGGEMVLVFDRGMVSDENLEHLEAENYLYITALDKNQIPGVEGVDIERFASLLHHHPNVVNDDENDREDEEERVSTIITEQLITAMGFEKYDPTTYFEDLGVAAGDGRRRVLVFNPETFACERKSRGELIKRAKAYLEKETKALSKAKKARSETTTRVKIDRQLKKLKANKFVDYDLESLVIENQKKTPKSFRIVPKETDATKEAIKKAERTDGLWMIITNVPGEKDDNNDNKKKKKTKTAGELISAYRDKNRVEEAFKDVKSFLKFQPAFVRTNDHVRAHYTVCILSYLLDVTVTNKLREHRKEKAAQQATSPRKVYQKLVWYRIGELRIKGTKHAPKRIPTLKPADKELLKLFECEYLMSKSHLKSIRVQ